MYSIEDLRIAIHILKEKRDVAIQEADILTKSVGHMESELKRREVK